MVYNYLKGGIMKRLLISVSLTIIMLLLGCGEEAATLIDQTQHLDQGYYWSGSFNADAGINLDVDIEVTSGGAVDVLLMDSTGFNQFQGIFKIDTLIDDSDYLDSLPPNDEVNYYISINTGDKITIDFSSDEPADIYLFHQNSTEIAAYTGTTAEHFDYTATQSETLNLYIYNPSPNVIVNYDLLMTKPQSATFTYYTTGSALNVTSKSYTFETPTTDRYYIVVNNADNVEGGATPQGPVDFHIIVTAQ